MASWTCQRQSAGQKCGQLNYARKRKCAKCGKTRPKRKQPAHRAVLELPYEAFVEANGGDFCGICGKEPSPTRRLDRDHDHQSGAVRGLLCHRHNRGLDWFSGVDELKAAIAYLERATRRQDA